MEIVLSAIFGEITNRSISFLINKFSKVAASDLSLDGDEKLRRTLMRVRIIVEEAEGRHIRNQAMLEQLKVLHGIMYRGFYVLEICTFRCRAHSEEDNISDDGDGRGRAVSRSFALSRFSPAKRIRLRGGGRRRRSSHGETDSCRRVLASLEITMANVGEFVMFLTGCPPLYRRVYSTYLVMEKCMFGHHVEMEYIIHFLTQTASSSQSGGGTQDSSCLDVLPIVGPMKSGKSTLIEHACNDERIKLLKEDDLDGERIITSIRDGGTVKHQRRHAYDDNDQRILLILELNGDVDEGTWSNLTSAYKSAGGGSKVIICSRSDKIAWFGTARCLKVEYPTSEAYWYFKALAFGSADPEEEPRLASMAMEIAASMNSSFRVANVMARMLRANFSAKFWRMAVSWIKGVRKRDGVIFGGHLVSPWQNKPNKQLQQAARRVVAARRRAGVGTQWRGMPAAEAAAARSAAGAAG
ncbi:hypothetical protein U9M48_036774 [Paspalum notatum var. saurae]|uniref:NB-ARC domain-containing protein n=1 Tax=Paspalum notatum var. saurae TaxID=547442 RepID=A0AAQ3UJU4_PASNO